jgi:membrane fusion protein, multidrug efflux system
MSTHTIEKDDTAAHDGARPRLVKPAVGGAEPMRSAAPARAGSAGARVPARLHEEPEPEGTTESAPASRRRPIPLIVGVLIALALTGWGVRHLMFARVHVSTDNAQIQGDIVPVLPRVSGFVAEVRVIENQRVRAGDTLVVLDDRDLAAKLAQAQADLRGAEAEGRNGRAIAQLAAARAAVADAEATAWKADADRKRFQSLAQQGLISTQELDSSEAAARSANAKLDAARDQARAAEAGLGSASAKAASALAARDEAALELTYTRLLAPMTGVVSRKDVQVGELVQVGQPLMSVVPLDDVWVVANLKETEVKNVKAGERVEIRVDSYPGQTFRGTVESLSPASGARFSLLPPDNATGNFTKVVQRIPVRIHIDGAQDPRRLLRPGMSVTVVIATA